MSKAPGIIAAVLAVTVASCGAVVLMVGGAGSGQAATCTPGGTTSTSQPITVQSAAATAPAASTSSLPASIGAYKGEQITNAAQIILAATALGLDARAQAVAVMTAIGESTLTNITHGDIAGPDSVGLFQQRANGAWGSLADRMNPRTAATSFLNVLVQVPGWESMAPTLAAHAVQRNADPYHYERFWPDAVLIVGTLSGDPNLADKLPATGELPCAPVPGGALAGPGGVLEQACSVVPDPTTGRGCLTPRMLNIVTQLQAQDWRLSCWDPHLINPKSDHPLGRACDAFPGTGGVLPTAAEKANGDALAASLIASADQLGVKYLIWYGQIWLASYPERGWAPYNGGGVYNPADIVGGHYDHVHISVF